MIYTASQAWLPNLPDGPALALLEDLDGGQDTITITTAQVWSGVGDPTHTPTVANQIYTDTSTGGQWSWYDNSWVH